MKNLLKEIPSHILLEAISDSIIVINSNGTIVGVNAQTERLFGYSREEIINKPVEIFIPANLKNIHSKHRGQYFNNPQQRLMETRTTLVAVRKDGTVVSVNISLSPLQTDSGIYAIAIIRNITELIASHDETLAGWSRAMDFRDHETENHTQRVTQMSIQIAHAMGLSETEIMNIRRGALLHDIGKMAVPDNILLKKDKLTDEEWEIMRQHPVYAYEMLSTISFVRPALDIPYCHHEKWDGTGYPRGLKGDEIPLAARIFAVVDVWDALRCDRPYRKGWEGERVCEYIKEQSGKHFDPQMVTIFLELFTDQLC